MSAIRELMVLVPGAARMARGSQRERLIKGMIATSERSEVTQVQADDVPAAAVRLKVTGGPVSHEVDVVEAYWNDLAPTLEKASMPARVVRGTSLIAYWAFSGVWKGFLNRKYLTLGMMAAGIALLTWYYGTVAMFLQALAGDQTANPTIKRLVEPFLPLFNTIGTWKVWVVASAFMAVIPVAVLVEMLDLTKRYMTNERAEPEGPPVRVQIRARVKEQIAAALKAGAYQRLTIVGHSFGAIVALDVLADLPVSTPVRFVTIGSPIELVKRRAPWIGDEVTKCLARPDVITWIDICSEGDWFASGSDLPEGTKTRSMRVPIEGTFVDLVYGRTHSRYFDRDEVVGTLVEAAV